MALTFLFKELWSIFDFLMSDIWFCEIQKSDIPPQKNRKSFEDLQIFDRKSGNFLPFSGSKYTSKSIDFSIFWAWFWTNFGYFTLLYWCFLVQFLIFSQKNWFSSQKVQKNWKSKNGVKTALTPLFKELWAIFGFLKFKNRIY